MELEDWIATAMCERFDEGGVVSPACLRKGLFTVGALDNLDHNPTSTTSQSSFYGTGISLYNFQLQKSRVNVDHQLPLLPLGPQSTNTLYPRFHQEEQPRALSKAYTSHAVQRRKED